MPRFSLWNSGRKGNDYKFIDRNVSQYFGMSGTAVYIHLYQGPYEQDDEPVYTPPTPGSTSTAPVAINERSVQDVLFLENRDRKYSTVVYEARVLYNINDSDFDLRQFGLFLSNDTLFLEFHLNDLVSLCGRRLINGDVLELPHARDDTIPGGLQAMNKFYVVEDGSRASSGYAPTWWPHIWRVKVSPMTASQEFADILDQNAVNPLGFTQGQIGDLFSTLAFENGINQAVVDEAVAQVPKRFFETQQYWYVPGSATTNQPPWIYAGDGIPPDGAALVGSGSIYPENPNQGDYFLRTDYVPAALFQWNAGRWTMQEVDWRGTSWSVASRLLQTFINNDAVNTMQDGTTVAEKQMPSQVIKPRADF